MTLLAPIYKFYFDRVAKRLARVGLQYHDAIAETGVYEKSLSRMSPEFQASTGRQDGRRQQRRLRWAPAAGALWWGADALRSASLIGARRCSLV